MVTFSRYTGAHPLAETSIDDIPLDEQRAFFDERGWPWEDFVPDEQDDEMYAAWASAQRQYMIDYLVDLAMVEDPRWYIIEHYSNLPGEDLTQAFSDAGGQQDG